MDEAYTIARREWYAKLRESGFKDIEYGSHLKPAFPTGVTIDPMRRAYEYDSTIEYFSIASEYLHARSWLYQWEKAAWEMHCDGYSIREINRFTYSHVKKKKRRSTHRMFDFISRIQREMFAWWKSTQEQRDIDNQA